MKFENIGLAVPEILLPRDGVNMEAWAVVACDQYTSQPEYWDKVAEYTNGIPSTSKLMLPEVYLETEKEEGFINNINLTMQRYLDDGVLESKGECFIALDRETSHQASRKGLLVALDLEHYSYEKGAETLIRATEGTILDRLPPRVKVRKDAPVELPHIMVLIDDPDKTVIEPLFEKELPVAYDFDLMMGGGHVKAYKVADEENINQVAGAIEKLADSESFSEKYGVEGRPVMLYAMGDGNHSFATAKAIWEDLKSSVEDVQAVMDHPARYALVELVNIHDEGLEFEPIHRVVFNVDTNDMFSRMKDYYKGQGSLVYFHAYRTYADMEKALPTLPDDAHHAGFVAGGKFGVVSVKNPGMNLVVATLQNFLDKYMEENPSASIDYIHGADVVDELGVKGGNIGFYLPPISKSAFFKTIIVDEALPRKTFSMGEADEKRYYIECRKIK